ncbi:MAG: hypothetical protein HY812_03180 [Planctomycetes bacterium]|nr:hypothetical protein [Planctomycetota bacterium]
MPDPCPARARLLHAACAAALALAWSASLAQAAPGPGRTNGGAPVAADAAAHAFLKKHGGRKAEDGFADLVLRVSAEVPEFAPGGEREDPRLRALRALAAALDAPANASKDRFKKRLTSGGSAPSDPRDFPLPRELMYRFGSRELEALDPDSKRIAAALKKGEAPAAEDLTAENRLDSLLRGCLPETELALSEIERRLDVQQSADRFAQFLESWRNHGPQGEESFYEALDRTAGTDEEVFFYDAMLAAFVGEFAGEAGKRWSRNEQHANHQQAFLTYRQYRGMIEATAFSLVLPPDVALPARLARYDYGAVGAGLFSLRHEIDLLAVLHAGNAELVVEEVRTFLAEHRLPEPLWERYDPLADFGRAVREAVEKKVFAEGLSLHQAWERQRDAGVRLAESIRRAAAQAAAG